jgi:UDP-N-acetylglucosamine 2-epimerase (non-hydrolysing)
MKILTITGTRPELIRLCVIIEKLDQLVDHILVYTNQNYDYNLSGRFFDELNIRTPNYYFSKEAKSFPDFLSNAILEIDKILNDEKPDKILILGDTNSGLLSIIAERYKIPIYHMEAGNRCYDNRLPEEANRKIIDSVSTYNLPYTENSKQNLLSEGYHKNYVFKTGNPINEVLIRFDNDINDSIILYDWYLQNIENDEVIKYVLVTAHRTENVDNEISLKNIIDAINKISEKYKVIFSVHPRTKNKLEKFNIKLNNNILISNPMGFFDFVKLEKNAICVISDSGTVQEECCILGVPSLTIRESTERQETIECGSNVLCGTKTQSILDAFNIVIKRNNNWIVPNEYILENVSDTIISILLGK